MLNAIFECRKIFFIEKVRLFVRKGLTLLIITLLESGFLKIQIQKSPLQRAYRVIR